MITEQLADNPACTSGLDEPFQRLSVAEAVSLIERGDVQVVDVRWRDDYLDGHIPGAVQIPLYEILSRKDELSLECDILLVCEVGVKSVLAAEMAASIGCERVYHLEGGMAEWLKQGCPVVD